MATTPIRRSTSMTSIKHMAVTKIEEIPSFAVKLAKGDARY
jgi:RecG-like helicase